MGLSLKFPPRFQAKKQVLAPGQLQSCNNREARHSCLAEKTGKNAGPPGFARVQIVLCGFSHSGLILALAGGGGLASEPKGGEGIGIAEVVGG